MSTQTGSPIEPFLKGFYGTPTMIASYWTRLSTKEKIDFLLSTHPYNRSKIIAIAADDESDFVRMLVYSPRYNAGHSINPLDKAKNDQSSLVRAAAYAAAVYAGGAIQEGLTLLKQEERLIMIGLMKAVSVTTFIDVIKNGLSTNTFSEEEAAELFRAFSRNPELVADYTEKQNIRDGLDFWVANSSFKAVWKYANEAPYEVANAIAYEFPLGHRNIQEINLEACTPSILEVLVWRGYKPLLDKIEKQPELFSAQVIQAVADSRPFRSKN
jgi:hypothetical protein